MTKYEQLLEVFWSALLKQSVSKPLGDTFGRPSLMQRRDFLVCSNTRDSAECLLRHCSNPDAGTENGLLRHGLA